MIRIIFFMILIAPLTNYGQVHSLPIETKQFKPIWEVRDAKLEKNLVKLVNENPQWKKLTQNKKLCIGLVDISDAENPRYAAINENHMMYAASLPKIAILLATFDAIHHGVIEYTDEVDQLMRQMISVSSNSASTTLIDLVGYDRIASVLQDKKYQLYNKSKKGGLWVGKRYASKGARNPDPLKGLSHAATVSQVCRFYYLLAYGQLINCSRSEQMLSYLIDPKLHHKFVMTLDRIAPDADVYRKSGTWKQFHADSVMVIGDEWRSYIFTVLVESESGESILRELMEKVDQLLQTYKSLK